ncbi:MAG: PAS domain S-box protein [Bacteroidia bacterium]
MENLNQNPGFPAEGEKENANNEIPELHNFYGNAVLPLHCINGSGIIVWANQAELNFLGYSKEEYINHHVSTFHADKHVIEDILGKLMKQEKLVNYYARVRTKSGEIKHVIINSNVFIKNEKFIHNCCYTTDITELKNAELKNLYLISELREKNTRLLWKAGSLKRSA